MNNQERILDRIQKMLKLANDDGATEGERDNALRMAHATLAKYNLSLEEVEDRAGKKKQEQSGLEPRMENTTRFYGRPWARSACGSIATLFFCSYIYVSHKKATMVKHYFIGKKSNAITASLIAEYVVKSILREGKRQQREEGQGNPWLRTFCWGAATRIRERVRELKDAENNPATEPGTALVLASIYQREASENQKFLAVKYPSLEMGQVGKGHEGGEAFGRGKSYGGRVSLSTQIGN